MTAQISERLLYQGEMVSMCSEPLNSYFEKAGIRPPFARNCTALYRGYVGLWEIFENRLYLNQLKGNPINGTELSVKSIFPSAGDKVFADWFTGTIRVPQGKMIEYLHHGYGSTFERDLFLEIEGGVVIGSRVQHNGISDWEGAPEGYQIGGMTTFPWSQQ